jgi:SagB-type dehydrogenase family enzyme
MAKPGEALWHYHEATKHSLASVTGSTHRLDWYNKPLPFKIYSTLEKIDPPEDLARLCLYTNGIMRWGRDGAGDVYGFRAAPCTGALYHIELYLAVGPRPDLPTGLYHYSAHDYGLRRLRDADVRGVLSEASGRFAPIATAPLIMVLSSTFWRNAWKYQARAYRHSYWDSGVIIANLLELTAAAGTGASVVMGFLDDAVNHMVGIDGEHEAAVALVAIGASSAAPNRSEDLPAIDYPTAPLSRRQVEYPAIGEAHRASSLWSAEDVRAWRGRAGGQKP